MAEDFYLCVSVLLCNYTIKTIAAGVLCHCVQFLCVLQTMATETKRIMCELKLMNAEQRLLLLTLLQSRKVRGRLRGGNFLRLSFGEGGPAGNAVLSGGPITLVAGMATSCGYISSKVHIRLRRRVHGKADSAQKYKLAFTSVVLKRSRNTIRNHIVLTSYGWAVIKFRWLQNFIISN